MRYYLSGLTDRSHARMALDAGIPNILIDPFQFYQIGLDLVRQFPHVTVASGSSALCKQEERHASIADMEMLSEPTVTASLAASEPIAEQ